MNCRSSLTQHCVGVLWDVLDLHARHSAIMALRAPFRNRTRIPPVSPRPGSCTIRACSRHSCGPLLTDPGKLAAIVAGPFGIVRPPPAARPAHPVVAAEDTPRQAPFARARLLGASGVAAGAQALAEIALGRAALAASGWGERTTRRPGWPGSGCTSTVAAALPPAQGPEDLQRRLGLRPAEPGRHDRRPAMACTCLLYTSDAADE